MAAEALRHLELAAGLTSGDLSLSVGTRPEVHSMAWAAHAHWLLGHEDEARSSWLEAIKLARAIDHPYSLAVALAYGSITHQIRHDMSELRDTVGELRELCDRYGFAYYREWVLVLDGWSRTDGSGIDLAQRGINNLKSEGSFARMPYWLSLLADLMARGDRPGTARATLDAALVAGHTHDDRWWLPEVKRMRAAYDDGDAAISRLTPLPCRWPPPTAASRCFGDASMTWPSEAPLIPCHRAAAFFLLPDANGFPRTLRERGGF